MNESKKRTRNNDIEPIGASEFAAALNSEDPKRILNALQRFTKIVKRQRVEALSLEEDESDHSDDEEGTDNSKKFKKNESWKEDTANYNVPFVGTAVSRLDMGTVKKGVWPSGLLQAYLQKSPLIVEFASDRLVPGDHENVHRMLLRNKQGRLSRSLTKAYFRALNEVLTAAVSIDTLKDKNDHKGGEESFRFVGEIVRKRLQGFAEILSEATGHGKGKPGITGGCDEMAVFVLRILTTLTRSGASAARSVCRALQQVSERVPVFLLREQNKRVTDEMTDRDHARQCIFDLCTGLVRTGDVVVWNMITAPGFGEKQDGKGILASTLSTGIRTYQLGQFTSMDSSLSKLLDAFRRFAPRFSDTRFLTMNNELFRNLAPIMSQAPLLDDNVSYEDILQMQDDLRGLLATKELASHARRVFFWLLSDVELSPLWESIRKEGRFATNSERLLVDGMVHLFELDPNAQVFGMLDKCLVAHPPLYGGFADRCRPIAGTNELSIAFRLSFLSKVLSKGAGFVLKAANGSIVEIRRCLIPKALRGQAFAKLLQSRNVLLVLKAIHYLNLYLDIARELVASNAYSSEWNALRSLLFEDIPTISSLSSFASKRVLHGSKDAIFLASNLAHCVRRIIDAGMALTEKEAVDLIRAFIPISMQDFSNQPLRFRMSVLHLLKRLLLLLESFPFSTDLLQVIVQVCVESRSPKECSLARAIVKLVLTFSQGQALLESSASSTYDLELDYWIDSVSKEGVQGFVDLVACTQQITNDRVAAELKLKKFLRSSQSPLSPLLIQYCFEEKVYDDSFHEVALSVIWRSLCTTSDPGSYAMCLDQASELRSRRDLFIQNHVLRHLFRSIEDLIEVILNAGAISAGRRRDSVDRILEYFDRSSTDRHLTSITRETDQRALLSALRLCRLIETRSEACLDMERRVRRLTFFHPPKDEDQKFLSQAVNSRQIEIDFYRLVALMRDEDSCGKDSFEILQISRSEESVATLPCVSMVFPKLSEGLRLEILESLLAAVSGRRDSTFFTLLLVVLKECCTLRWTSYPGRLSSLLFEMWYLLCEQVSPSAIISSVERALLSICSSGHPESRLALTRQMHLKDAKRIDDFVSSHRIEDKGAFLALLYEHGKGRFSRDIDRILYRYDNDEKWEFDRGSFDNFFIRAVSSQRQNSTSGVFHDSFGSVLSHRIEKGLRDSNISASFDALLSSLSQADDTVIDLLKRSVGTAVIEVIELSPDCSDTVLLFGLRFFRRQRALSNTEGNSVALETLISLSFQRLSAKVKVLKRSLDSSDSDTFSKFGRAVLLLLEGEDEGECEGSIERLPSAKLVRSLLKLVLDSPIFRSISSESHSLSIRILKRLVEADGSLASETFGMIVSHSRFFDIVSLESSSTFETQQIGILELLLSCLTEIDSLECDHLVIKKICSSHEASLSKRDALLRAILHRILIVSGCLKCSGIENFLWTNSSIEGGNEYSAVSAALVLPSLLSFKRVVATLRAFPVDNRSFALREIENGLLDELESKVPPGNSHRPYDPGFVIPLSLGLLEIMVEHQTSTSLDAKSGMVEYSMQLVESGLFALCLASLSSKCGHLRGLAFGVITILNRFMSEKENVRGVSQILLIVNSLHRGILLNKERVCEVDGKFPRLPIPAALFLAKSSIVLKNPDHSLFTDLNRYFLKTSEDEGAFSDFNRIPAFVPIFCSVSDDRLHVLKAKSWAIEFLAEAIAGDVLSIRAALSCHAFDMLFVYFSSSFCSETDRLSIVEILKTSIRLSEDPSFLTSMGLESWMKVFLQTATNTSVKVTKSIIDLCGALLSKGGDDSIRWLVYSIFIVLIRKSIGENCSDLASHLGVCLRHLYSSTDIIYLQTFRTINRDAIDPGELVTFYALQRESVDTKAISSAVFYFLRKDTPYHQCLELHLRSILDLPFKRDQIVVKEVLVALGRLDVGILRKYSAQLSELMENDLQYLCSFSDELKSLWEARIKSDQLATIFGASRMS